MYNYQAYAILIYTNIKQKGLAMQKAQKGKRIFHQALRHYEMHKRLARSKIPRP
jgi:uncharacterized protein YjbK